MPATPKHNIKADTALDLIMSGKVLADVYVEDKLNLSTIYANNFEKELLADNCIFEHLEASCVQFTQAVKFTNCTFQKCSFTFTYFLNGLIIDNCVFESYLDMQAGGHNSKEVSITNSIFKDFVNFFDCWYESDVTIRGNDFQKGTNLTGTHKETGIRVQFDKKAVIENNKGRLDHEDEGNLEINMIDL